MNFAFYGRVSTEDAQDPEVSLGWQLRRARSLVDPAGGEIVTQYFDIGLSRSLPWSRRPEATRLLADLRNPDRGFTAVVVGEPQRAFYGHQFSLTFPVLTHYGVQLWVPEVGGPVDPGSEAHDMMMMLYGGISRGERTRTQLRVKTAMTDLASRTDRFLGGRPPYGYRLADAGPHPNQAKAAAGQRLHRLEPDPVAAPVVNRIYNLFGCQEVGLRAVAEILTREGIPSPSAYDPARNSHRNPSGWSHSAVRAILINPTYQGVRVWGKQERVESLLDPDDVAAGNRTRMRWRNEADWVTPGRQTHEPLVTADQAALVAGRIAGRTPGKTRPRTSVHPYCLRGLIYCRVCGTKLQGSFRQSRNGGTGRVLYRCEVRSSRALPPDVDHPPTLYVNEAAILAHLDPWIGSFLDPSWLAASQVEDPAEAARRTGQAAELGVLDRKISNLIAAIEIGGDTKLLTAQLAQRNAEREALKTRVAIAASPAALTADQIAELVQQLGGIAAILREATPAERGAAYQTLGIRMTYDHTARQVSVTADPARVGGWGS
jgi:DNA invertase Pin-like site-specific DNA recombinase